MAARPAPNEATCQLRTPRRRPPFQRRPTPRQYRAAVATSAANGSNAWGAPELEDEIAQDQIGAPGQGGTEQAEPQGDGARADRIDPPAVSQPGLRAFPLRRSRRGHFGFSIQCQKWGER